MLSAQDNELLCKVGPGTPMGDLMRQLLDAGVQLGRAAGAGLPAAAHPPAGREPDRLPGHLGQGRPDPDACPHRGASLFFGRNEEEGLRCVYHGWKFDVTGACIDMPSEPAESNFKNKVRASAYPCVERNGIVWAYMGPRADAAAAAALRGQPGRRGQRARAADVRECNWMQALEGDIDTSHLGFLHLGANRAEDQDARHVRLLQLADRAPRYDVLETPTTAPPTAPTVPPRRTPTTGASPTSSSPASR